MSDVGEQSVVIFAFIAAKVKQKMILVTSAESRHRDPPLLPIAIGAENAQDSDSAFDLRPKKNNHPLQCQSLPLVGLWV